MRVLRPAGLVAVVTIAGVGVGATPTASAASGPAAWSDHRLAMQLVLAGVQMDRLDHAVTWARNGVGGIVLFGTPPDDLGAQLRQVHDAADVSPFVSSDEEGGEVQRLATLIYRLPSAESMAAHRTRHQVRVLAEDYGARMRRLGVTMDLAPVADLYVAGHYMAEVHRAFASDPTVVSEYVNAWQRGMRASGVVPVVKHWPGLGHSGNTDMSLQTDPPLHFLRRHDLLSFRAAFDAHVPAAMVGNMVVPGLSETSSTPASLSPTALALLRRQGGSALLVITDSLAAGAVRDGLGLSQPQAAVRALEAGADMALVDGISPGTVATAIVAAMKSGAYPRQQALASVRRILAAKTNT